MDAATDLDRARVYRALARLFRPPDAGLLRILRSEDLGGLRPALHRLGAGDTLLERAVALATALTETGLADLGREWDRHFEPSGGLCCSPNETTHTAKTSQEAWLKTYRLADIAGFYRAFGVEAAPGGEKVDHVGVELEFLHLVATKAAAARARDQREQAEVCDEATRAFLADHLGLWCGDLVEKLEATGKAAVYLCGAELLRDFVAFDAGRLGPPRPSDPPHPLLQEPRTEPRPMTTK